MSNERNAQNNPRSSQDQKMPEKILNTAQDPHSIQDPLEQQLEKSKHMNLPEEARKLDELKRKNRESDPNS